MQARPRRLPSAAAALQVLLLARWRVSRRENAATQPVWPPQLRAELSLPRRAPGGA